MNFRITQNCCFIFFIIFIMLSATKAYASGFFIYNHDATASALGLAYSAQVQNPSAVLYNPAAINQLEGTQISFGSTLIYSNVSFRNARTGNKTDQDSHFFLLPTFYATKKLNNKWSVGFGLFSPYGLTSNWPSDWEGRYLATFAQLRSFFLNPVISYQVTPKFSIGGGFSMVYSDILQRKKIKITPISDGEAKFKGDDFKWAYNIGLLYKINDKLKFGLTYRSTVHMKYKGDISFRVPKVLKDIVPQGGASINIDLPGFVTTGLCYEPNERLTIEFDVIWVDWSVYDKLDLKFDKKVPAIMKKNTAPIIRNYHDTYDFCFGISYKATDAITLRAGYLYDPSAVPEENNDPILPDADKNIYTMGIGYKRNKLSFNILNYLVFYRDRNVRNNRDGLNGTYTAFVNMFGMNIIYSY